jgi:hypothetical protein
MRHLYCLSHKKRRHQSLQCPASKKRNKTYCKYNYQTEVVMSSLSYHAIRLASYHGAVFQNHVQCFGYQSSVFNILYRQTLLDQICQNVNPWAACHDKIHQCSMRRGLNRPRPVCPWVSTDRQGTEMHFHQPLNKIKRSPHDSTVNRKPTSKLRFQWIWCELQFGEQRTGSQGKLGIVLYTLTWLHDGYQQN